MEFNYLKYVQFDCCMAKSLQIEGQHVRQDTLLGRKRLMDENGTVGERRGHQ